MRIFTTKPFSSTGTILLVQVLVILLQTGLSYTLTLGRLAFIAPIFTHNYLFISWLIIKLLVFLFCLIFLLTKRVDSLFRSIYLMNLVLTISLVVSSINLVDILVGYPGGQPLRLFADVFSLAITNVLIFSIWYWIIDPPGIDEKKPSLANWEFLFPQRATMVPGYENWIPGFADYLHLAFTTSLAFTPTDAPPLSRKAKMLMIFQSSLSVITMVIIVGRIINSF